MGKGVLGGCTQHGYDGSEPIDKVLSMTSHNIKDASVSGHFDLTSMGDKRKFGVQLTSMRTGTWAQIQLGRLVLARDDVT